MTNDIYQTPPTRDKWTFRKLNGNIKYQHQSFWKTMFNVTNNQFKQ
jgi:hypothetical protein